MTTKSKFVIVCDGCGVETDEASIDWMYLTQPSVAYCPACRGVRDGGGMTYKSASERFDEDYFLRGKQTGKSLYEDYRWLPDLTVPMASRMLSHLGVAPEDTILDFGCARGYLVRALRELGYNAWGWDTSQWARDHADEDAKKYVYTSEPFDGIQFDWIIAKDVLEHISESILVIDKLMEAARKGILVIVPLAHGRKYDVPEYELDATHVWRRPLSWWVGHFCRSGWSVTGQYRIVGIKDNYAQYRTGNGFVTVRRIE